MQARIKKAACRAAFGYLAFLALGMGMLRAAQQTRRTLYGGQPVLAQISKPLPDAADDPQYRVALGGGEWEITLSLPELTGAAEAAAAMPPCTAKLLLRIAALMNAAADQTAELITGMENDAFSLDS